MTDNTVHIGAWEADLKLNSPEMVRVVRDIGGDRCALVTAHGELDMLTSPVLAAAIGEALADAPSRLVVDLTGTTFCGVAAVTTLVSARGRAKPGTPIHVVGGRCVARVFALAAPDEALPLYSTLQEALAAA